MVWTYHFLLHWGKWISVHWFYIMHLASFYLKVQSCKLNNNKYMIASTQITNTEIFGFIVLLLCKLSSRKFCLSTEKTIETVKK